MTNPSQPQPEPHQQQDHLHPSESEGIPLKQYHDHSCDPPNDDDVARAIVSSADDPSRLVGLETEQDNSAAPAMTPQLLERLVATSIGPLSRVRETLDASLDEVAAWIGKVENRRTVFNLISLLDAQSQMLACQQRTLAVARLAELASKNHTPPETMRRACADLLKLRLVEPPATPGRKGRANDMEPLADPPPPAAPSAPAESDPMRWPKESPLPPHIEQGFLDMLQRAGEREDF